MIDADVLRIVHLILEIGFLFVTFLLLAVTVVNRMRVRQVLLTWRHGAPFGVPLWPTVFLVTVFGFFGSALLMGWPLSVWVLAGYLVGGACWLAAGVLSASVLVTEHGIVQSANRADQAVAWRQMVDYFEQPAGHYAVYVFFYLDASDRRCRLELVVPASQQAAFRRLVREKLDARFDLSAQQVYGKSAMEG